MLKNDFRKLILSIEQGYKAGLREIARRITRRGQDILRGYVPIDTENLKREIKGEFFETRQGIQIRFFVNNIDLDYGKKTKINAQTLALILAAGTGKSGVRLKRTRNNEFAKRGQSTEDWFNKGMKKIEEELNLTLATFDFSKYIR